MPSPPSKLGLDVHSVPYIIRLATLDDARQMLDIYEPVVLGTAISFEIETPSETGRAIGGLWKSLCTWTRSSEVGA